MPVPTKIQRILLKLSGESLGANGSGVDPDVIAEVADRVARVQRLGVEVAIVVGGGNLLRGAEFSKRGTNRATADHMGMLATAINTLALQDGLERAGVECGRHDHQLEVGPEVFLQVQRPGQGDVAVEMALVEFVENDRPNARQARVGQHLPQQNALRDKPDPGARGADAVEPDLVADLAPGLAAALAGDTCREHARRETAGLEHHHLAVRQQPAVEQHLGNLGGLAGARGRLEHHARTAGECGHEGVFQFKDGEV